MTGNRMPQGLRKVRGDWANPLYAKPKAKAPHAMTEDQRSNYEQLISEVEARWNRPVPPQERAIEKVIDREARIAVEGDTDGNHDNIEAAE